MNILSKIDTPCIGVCSTVYGDVICRGCKRQAQEVIDWNTYQANEKQKVFERLANSIENTMQDKIAITDISQLRLQLDAHSVRYREEESPLCWVYHLLRIGADKIHDINKYGFQMQEAFQTYSLAELFALVDAEILEQAQQKNVAISRGNSL